jgi:hypothetical protein
MADRSATQVGTATYVLEGTSVEACSCTGPCPCDVGEDPDGGHCESLTAYHIDRGRINNVDVAGLSLVAITQIPGNVRAGNWRMVLYVDANATPEQRQALIDAWGGTLGGPLADLAQLVGERIAVHSAPIDYYVRDGKGTLRVGEIAAVEMTPFTAPDGRTTTLHDTTFSTSADGPKLVGKATHHRVQIPEHNMRWEFSGRNATQSTFRFRA